MTDDGKTPVLARTRLGLNAARKLLGSPVVLVPTMGALHEGHIALLRRAAALSQPNGSAVVSVFVNPLQFGAGEDLGRYPRSLDADLAICGREGVEVVFAPNDAQMYPRQQLVTVDPGPMGQVLEGASRPGFFTGPELERVDEHGHHGAAVRLRKGRGAAEQCDVTVVERAHRRHEHHR